MPSYVGAEQPASYATPCGKILFVFDLEQFDFHIDAFPGYRASTMATVLGRAALWGLETLTEDECTPDLLPGGGVRIYLTPVVPEAVVAAEALATDRPADPTQDLEGAA